VSTETNFNLRALIREVCDSSTMADPAQLAAEVARRVPQGKLRVALDQCLPHIVQQTLSQSRSSGGQVCHDTQAVIAAGSNKVTAIRTAWRRMLRERIAVGPEPGDWRFLAECYEADLLYAAQLREDHARRNIARAEQLRSLAEQLAEHGVKTVAELPEDTLSGVLAGAA